MAAPSLLVAANSQSPTASPHDMLEILPLLSPKQLADAIWGFAKQGHKPTNEFMATAAQEVLSKLDHFRSQDLSNTIWALAVLKYQPDAGWWAQFERQVYNNVTDFTSREIANLMWALAVLDHRPEWILDSVLAHVHDNFASSSANSLHLILWSLGKLGHVPGVEWMAEFQRVSQASFFQFSPSEMANVIWAFAKLGTKLPSLYLDNFLMVAQWRFPSFSAKLLSILVWSAAMLDHHPSADWVVVFQQQIREKFDEFSGQELACTAWALRRFGYTGDANAVFYMLEHQEGFSEVDYEILSNPKLLGQVMTWRGSSSGGSSSSGGGGSSSGGGGGTDPPPTTIAMAIRKECSKSMGELLLKGWPMLAETCFDCQVPLMKDPASGDRLCVNCDRNYPAGMDLDACMADEEESEEEGSSAGVDGGGTAADDIPDFSTHPVSVADAAEAAAGGVVSPSPVASTSAVVYQAPRAKAPQNSDRACELLSTKMLQGWALLETTCPRCDTPLVRNREKRMRCVLCDAWVCTEADAPAMMQPTPAPTAAPPRKLTPAVGPARGRGESLQPRLNVAAAPFEVGGAAVEAEQPAWPRAYQALPAIAAAAAAPGEVEAPGAGADGATTSAPPYELLSSLSQALQDKLWQASRLLASTPADKPLVVKNIAAMVSECLDTLAKVRQAEARMQAREQQHARKQQSHH
ncbi:hypothetical protein FOA52_010580 [Chlamydomonas sp. UWO 241]|nr:hypothetical protein FOA52_010580 [Chlamydomonas sp. UWO 241]